MGWELRYRVLKCHVFGMRYMKKTRIFLLFCYRLCIYSSVPVLVRKLQTGALPMPGFTWEPWTCVGIGRPKSDIVCYIYFTATSPCFVKCDWVEVLSIPWSCMKVCKVLLCATVIGECRVVCLNKPLCHKLPHS